MCSLVPHVKHYFLTMKEDDTIFKITSQPCNGIVTFKVTSEELLYITFIHSVLSTIVLYLEDLDP